MIGALACLPELRCSFPIRGLGLCTTQRVAGAAPCGPHGRGAELPRAPVRNAHTPRDGPASDLLRAERRTNRSCISQRDLHRSWLREEVRLGSTPEFLFFASFCASKTRVIRAQLVKFAVIHSSADLG